MKCIKRTYYKNLRQHILSHWKLILIVAIAGLLAGGLWGIKSYKNSTPTPQQQQKYDSYQEDLQSYQDAIDQTRTNIETAKQQATDQQKYVDESIYMNLDPFQIYTSTIQYAIQPKEGTDFNLVWSAIYYYVVDGGMYELANEKKKDLKPEYWPAVLGISQNNNMIDISINHYDEATGKEIISFIGSAVEAYAKNTVAKEQGDFTLKKLSASTYTRTDAGIEGEQNNQRNLLTSYQNSIKDNEAALVSAKDSYDTFVEDNEAENRLPQPMTITGIVKLAVLGFVGGIFITIFLLILYYLADTRIRTTKELQKFGFHIIGDLKNINHYEDNESITQTIHNLEILSKKQDYHQIYISLLSESEPVLSLAKHIQEQFEDSNNLSITLGSQETLNAKAAQDAFQCDATILLSECGRTKIEQIKQTKEFMEKFGVTIMGTISVD